MPFGRDQFEVAGRVGATGSGSTVMPWELTPDALRSAVDAATTMRPGAETVADGFARAGGAMAAAEAMESLLTMAARRGEGAPVLAVR